MTGPGAQLDPGRLARDLTEPLQIVRTHRVAEEVMLSRPVAVESQLLGQHREPQLATHDLGVVVLVAIVLKDGKQPDVH